MTLATGLDGQTPQHAGLARAGASSVGNEATPADALGPGAAHSGPLTAESAEPTKREPRAQRDRRARDLHAEDPANAAKVMESMLGKPEMRVVISLIEDPSVGATLDARFVSNFISFLTKFTTQGTRHREDQNAVDVLLTAVVDGLGSCIQNYCLYKMRS